MRWHLDPSHVLRWILAEGREWALRRAEASACDLARGGWTRVGQGRGQAGQISGVLASEWVGPGQSLAAEGPGGRGGWQDPEHRLLRASTWVGRGPVLNSVTWDLCELLEPWEGAPLPHLLDCLLHLETM